MKLIYTLLFCLISLSVSYGQGELPVNMHTGTPIINVPIATFTAGDLATNINLSYDASGVKVGAPSGLYGVNWRLEGSGSITREVRGFPDDFERTTSPIRKGWLFQNGSGTSVAADVATFANSSDTNSGSPCTDESADATKLNSWTMIYDPEPDLFSFSVDGMSGKFVFDNGSTPQIRLIPWQDIQITPIINGTSKRIDGFEIISNNGTEYTFNYSVVDSRESSPLSGAYTSAFSIENNYYDMGTSGTVAWSSAWHLTNMKSSTGAEISFGYTMESTLSSDTVKVKVKDGGSSGYIVENLYRNQITGGTAYLTSVQTKTMSLSTTSSMVSTISIYDKRNGDHNSLTSKLVKEFHLSYAASGDGSSYLSEVKVVSDDEELPPHKFFYHGMVPNSPYTKDFWGYYNAAHGNNDLFPTLHVYPDLPEHERIRLLPIPGYVGTVITLPGANREPNAAAVKTGSLTNIQYPWGGMMSIEYESNDFYDPVAAQTFIGNGIRVKSATYVDGRNPDNEIKKNFTYKNASNQSSGVLISRPQFLIPLWEHRNKAGDIAFNTTDKWLWFTARTNYDLSSGSKDVVYKEVKVYRPGQGSQPGLGHAHFEYEVPADWGSAAVGNWTPTPNKSARYGCPTGGIVESMGSSFFPYAHHPEYDYERGLIKYKTEYDHQGRKIRQTYTTYQYVYKTGSTPVNVKGVRFEMYPNADTFYYLFGAYTVVTDLAKVVDVETVTTFDENDVSKNLSQSVEYFYTSSSHKLLSEVHKTNPDGTLYKNYLRYPWDYGTRPTNTPMGQLQTTNRHGIPVEQYSSVTRAGESQVFTGGSVTEFGTFGTQTLPAVQHVLRSPVTSYTPSSFDGSGALTLNSGYEPVATIVAYDTIGRASKVIGEDLTPVTTVWSSILDAPVAMVTNASLSEFAFSDFEVGTEASFELESLYPNDIPPYEPVFIRGTGRTGLLAFGDEMIMTKTITKTIDNYWFTGWWNKGCSAFGMILKIKSTDHVTTYSTHTFNMTPSSEPGGWDFFKHKISLAGVPATFVVEITFTDNWPSCGAGQFDLVDDFAFYPEHARMVTTTYDFPFGPSSTTSDDKSAFTVYDKLGRPKLLMDRDKNIKVKKSYQFNSNE